MTETSMKKDNWQARGNRLGWWAPRPASAVWRLPIVRHLRFGWHAAHIASWYSRGPGSIGIPTGYDAWVLCGIRGGWL